MNGFEKFFGNSNPLDSLQKEDRDQKFKDLYWRYYRTLVKLEIAEKQGRALSALGLAKIEVYKSVVSDMQKILF